MNVALNNRRPVVLQVGALFALVLVLVAVSIWFRLGSDADNSKPLNPNEVMRIWPDASIGRKKATAELLLSEMQRDGKLGPRTEERLAKPGEKQKMIDELTSALDASADRHRSEYVSPSLSITYTANRCLPNLGWGQ